MFSAFQTFGKLGAIGKAIAAAWSPLSLWPDGIDSPGMWISPRTLDSQWQDYTGTTPVATPGTVADSSNPVGLALDLRAGNPVPLGPELVTNGDFSNGTTGWTLKTGATISGGVLSINTTGDVFYIAAQPNILTQYRTYRITATCTSYTSGVVFVALGDAGLGTRLIITSTGTFTGVFFYDNVSLGLDVRAYGAGGVGATVATLDNISVKEVPGNHMRQDTSTARPLLSAYDGQTLGPGNTYDATGFPTYQQYDGTDDGMATAAFSAGTLIDGLDCMIAVRRDSAAATYLISDTGSRGFFEWESGDTNRPDVSAGTPTYYVDGVAITATKGALFTALTVGDWHILEARGLDLSTWTKVEVSSLVSYRLNGPRGDILLYPSTASTEDKDAARQWLADYYGVTLP